MGIGGVFVTTAKGECESTENGAKRNVRSTIGAGEFQVRGAD